MKKLLGLLLSCTVLLMAACGKQQSTTADSNSADAPKTHQLVLASTGSDADIWRYIATLPETKAAGIELKVQNFTDYVAMNSATANKEVDANAFQSYAYFLAYNAENKDKISVVSTTYLEPMGIYTNKYKKIDEFPQGASIAIPNDAANEARALLLLQSAGLLKLKADFNPATGTTADVIENAKQLQIKPVQMASAVRVKDDVDAIILGNTLAMEGGLNVLKDAIFYEPIDQSTRQNVNIVATAAGRENDPLLQKLGELYHSDAVQKYVDQHFQGTKVDVKKPISYLTSKN